MNVVVDTNIFVSSFLGGNPGRIIDLWISGDITLCLSGPIVDEYIKVLKNLNLEDNQKVEAVLDLFSQNYHALFITETPTLCVVKKDPADDKFLECAVALHAEYVISGDRALLAVEKYMNIRIVNPLEYLELGKKMG
jgi:uncharacterized protein